MAFQLTQVIECSQVPESFHETDERIQIGTLTIGDKEHKIFRGITRIGRLPTCEIHLQDITVSKIHSEIEADRTNVFICDLDSSNKTRLNDVFLRPRRYYEVKDGAKITFGLVEGKFFLLESSDNNFRVPETPDSSLKSRHQSISDDGSFIQNTPSVDVGRFRRPQLPILKKAYKSLVINDISQVETQVQSSGNVQELETQCAMTPSSKETRCEFKNHIQELETQVSEINDIEDVETQFSMDENVTPDLQEKTSSSRSDIQNMDTHILEARSRNIQVKSGEKSTIQDLETQFDQPQGDIQDMQTQILGIGNNKERSENKEDTSKDKIEGKGQSANQKQIEELNTQISGSTVPETGKESEEEIYDLPTQPNWDYLENLKKQELLEDSQSPRSSPDLVNRHAHLIVESDEEPSEERMSERVNIDDEKYREIDAIVKENVFSNAIDAGNDDMTENKPQSKNSHESGLNEDTLNDFERTKSLKKKADINNKFKRNGIISESDSEDDDNNVRNEEKLSCYYSKNSEKGQSPRNSQIQDSEKNRIKESTNVEKAKPGFQSVSENDFDQDDEEKENQPTSSLKSNSKNSSESKDSELLPEVSRTSVQSDNHSESETDYEDSVEIEEQNSLRISKNNFEKSKSCSTEKEITKIPPEIQKLLDTPKRRAEEDCDSDDSSSAPTQLIIQPRRREIQKRLKDTTQEGPPPIQIIPVSPGSPRNDDSELNNTSYEDLMPTQKLDFGKRKSPAEEESTGFRGFKSSHVPQNLLDDDESDGDMAPTQKLELPKRFQSRKLSLKSPPADANNLRVPERSGREIIDDLPPTQILDDNETQTQLIINDTSKKAHVATLLDDDECQTQLIDTITSSKVQSTVISPIESPVESSAFRLRSEAKVSSIDKTPVKRSEHLVGMITSTPALSPSPNKRRKFSLSLKQNKEETEITERKSPLAEDSRRIVDDSDDSTKKHSEINSKNLHMASKISGPSRPASSTSTREKVMKRKKNGKNKPLKKKISEEKSTHISDSSDDEDMDYAKVNAMADRFIASSRIGVDQSSRVTRQITPTKAPNNPVFDKNKRIEDKTPSEETNSRLKKIPNEVEKRSSPVRQPIPKKEVEAAGKSRGRPRITKTMQKEELPPTEVKQKIKTETMRKRKLQSKDRSSSTSEYGKRGKMDSNSDESTAGAESQEVQRILQGNDTLQDSPSRSIRAKGRSFESGKMTFCVLFTGIEDEDESMKKAVVALGGSTTNDPYKATILVTDKVRRTIKFFCAVSRSILIASVDWLDASVKSGRFQDPKKYLLHDSTAEAKFRFSLNKSLSRAKTKRLLEGYTVLLTPKISGPSIADLKTMVQISGGKPLVRAPRAWTNTSIIISCEEDLPYVKRILSKTKVQIPVVSIEFLLSGILRQQLEYEEFSLPL